ncbi:hypothetical protein [Archaeoglobus veneficus]|uniref:Uncharacterized protein n=1 Tax=Archaeoglobus veneficus (strain DSM 11195 / SNP6) TaxID=693661 RepID=F2KPW7_ARCVS|nr:hypothetical protein [Archaeoglobus veneficus]AEA46474.1 hypothetical protein Arcve_0442 [Archaeoglobus veneficus SNP6]
MRRFDWRSFERKGKNKKENKEEKLLMENLEDLRKEIMSKGGEDIKEIAKLVLKEEE